MAEEGRIRGTWEHLCVTGGSEKWAVSTSYSSALRRQVFTNPHSSLTIGNIYPCGDLSCLIVSLKMFR